jgi:hypothetical protein
MLRGSCVSPLSDRAIELTARGRSADPAGGGMWQSMNDVVSRHRLSPVNESLQFPEDEIRSFTHPARRSGEVDKLSCETMQGPHAAMS